jgi:uncharacterized protein (TIGR02246 family)
MDFFNSGRVADVAACYTEDAQFLVPGQEPFAGRAAIAAVLGGLRGDGNRLTLETLEVEAGGDFAWEVGRYSVATPNGAEADRGKYVVVWKRAGGEWRLHRDIINSSLPPGG